VRTSSPARKPYDLTERQLAASRTIERAEDALRARLETAAGWLDDVVGGKIELPGRFALMTSKARTRENKTAFGLGRELGAVHGSNEPESSPQLDRHLASVSQIQ